MFQRLILLICLAIIGVGCQFSENLVLNEDGSGTMSVEVNMKEMMAFSNLAEADSTVVKIDTLVQIKRFLEERKDSIAGLSLEEQTRLKKLENFNLRVKMDSETSEMFYNISTSFNNVKDANDIVNGLNQVNNVIPSLGDPSKENISVDVIGVTYSFNNKIFIRDAYIKDIKMHEQQLDSLVQAEGFLGSVGYALNYTFPKPIKRASDPEATISNDKKSITLKKSFVEYFKNPDILDLEVELED